MTSSHDVLQPILAACSHNGHAIAPAVAVQPVDDQFYRSFTAFDEICAIRSFVEMDFINWVILPVVCLVRFRPQDPD